MTINEALMNSVVSVAMLQSTPSHQHGFSFALERDARLLACQFIVRASAMLELPQLTSSTAQVLLQRYYFADSIGSLPMFNVVGGAIYLASKLEETPKRMRDIITVLDHLRKKTEGLEDTSLDTGSNLYYMYREGILQAELTILAKLAFNVHVEHPDGFLLHYLASLGFARDLTMSQLSINYLNDRFVAISNASHRTIVSVLYQPSTIACGIIYLAARQSGIGLPLSPPWYTVFDAELEDLELIGELIMEIYKVKQKLVCLPAKLEPDEARPRSSHHSSKSHNRRSTGSANTGSYTDKHL